MEQEGVNVLPQDADAMLQYLKEKRETVSPHEQLRNKAAGDYLDTAIGMEATPPVEGEIYITSATIVPMVPAVGNFQKGDGY